jgi:hypothetical protein
MALQPISLLAEEEFYEALCGSLKTDDSFLKHFLRAVELSFDGVKLTR